MSIKWWTESSLRKRTYTIIGVSILSASLVLTSGCSLLPKEQAEEDLPAITPPSISQKPEYTVTTGTIVSKVRGIGEIKSRMQESLFFTQDSGRISDIYVQSGDKVTAGQVLAQLDTTDLENQIRSKELQMRSEKLDMIEILRKADEIPPDQLEQAKIEFELKRMDLVKLQEQLDRAKLVAPFDGSIISISYNKGDQVQGYQEVMLIADLSQLEVAVEISKDDQKKVAVGMDAVVTISANGEFNGKVSHLPVPKKESNNNPYPPYPGGQQQTKDSIENYLLIDIGPLPETVTRGAPLSVSVITDQRENVMVIPPAALRSLAGRTYVQVVEKDGTKREVDVEVGQQTATQVEIVKGLEVGQKVVGR